MPKEELLGAPGLNPLGGRSHGGLLVGTDCITSSSILGFGGAATGTVPTVPFDFTRFVCATRSRNRLSNLQADFESQRKQLKYSMYEEK